MGLEEIRTRLDAFVAAGTVPPEERDSVRAQVDELVASDPAGADLYRTALARLDPHLFPPPDATAWDRLLRAVRPRRPVSRESVEDQGFMMTSSLFAYSVLTPALRGLLTGEFPWLTPGQLAMTAAVTAVASVPAIYYLMPYGKSAQNQEDPEQNRIGRRTVVEAETLHTIFFMHFFGRIFGWDPLVTVWNATWQGITKGYPMSEIYRRWGDERQGLWMRQGAMILMMTDQAVASSVASAGSSGFSLAQMGWVAAFNLLLGKALALIPERGREITPQSAADPPPAVVPTEANARLQRRLAEAMQNQPETYVEAHCIQNTVLFIGRNLTDETIRHARILIVINRDVRTRGQLERLRPDRWFGSLNSTRPRVSLIPKERWKYHVVLEVEGRVYDFDYRGKPGIPLADYAQEMFPDGDHDVVVIPASEFVGQLSIPGIDFQDRLSELIFDPSRERRPLSDYAASRIRESGPLEPYSNLTDRSEIYRAWGAVQISRIKDGKFTLLYLSGESSTPFHFAKVFEHHLSVRAGELSSLDVIIFSIDLPKGRKLGEPELNDLEKRILEVLEPYQFGRGVAIVLKSGRKEQKIYVVNAMARLAELRGDSEKDLAHGDPAFAVWVGEKRLKKHLEQRPADRARILEVYRLFQKRSLDDFRLEDPTRLRINYSRSISEGRGVNSLGVFAASLAGVDRPLAVKLIERGKFAKNMFAADTVRNYAILSAWGIGPTFYGLVDIPEKDAIGLVMDEVENDESFIPYGLSSRDDKLFDPETLAQLSGIKEFFEIFSAIPAPFEILRNADGKLFAIDVSSISYFQAKAEELLKRLPPDLSALYISGAIKADLVPDREVARTIAKMVFEYRDSLQSALHSLRELGLPVPPDHEIDTELAHTDYGSFLNLTETRIREMRAAAASMTPGLLALQRQAAEEMAAHPEVFAPNQCHFTVRDFLRRHIPRDQLSHVRVLCIRKKGGGDVIGGRGALKPNETLGDFQTTIEIGGRIYGYWYRGRPGVSIDTYVREMFPKEDLDDLTVLSIPAQEYVDYPDAAEALPYFWHRDDHKVVPLRDYVHAAMDRYGHQADFDDIENRLETYERYTTTVDVATNGDGITIRYNGGSGFTPAIFSQKLRDALGPTKESLTQARRVQLTVFVSADAVVEAQDIQQVATKELESAGYSGPVNLRLFRGTQASTRLFSIEPATAHPDPGPGMDGVPSPVLLAGGDFLAGGDWLAAPGLADYDLSWVPRSAAVIGGFALLFGGLVALDRYRTYRWQRDQLYRHLETWPEVRAVMHDALKAFRGNDTLPDWHVNIWRRKPNIVEHRFKTALAVSGMLRSVMAASEATLSSETKAESGVALREWAQSLTDLMNDFRGSFPPEVWKIYGTAALEKLGRAVGSLQTMIDTRLDQMSSEQDFPRRLSLVGMVSPSAQRRINLGRSSIQLLNRSIEEFEWDMLRDSLQILVVDGNPGQMPVRSIDSARGRGASGGVPNGTQWSRQVEKVAELLLGLIQLLHRHPERTIHLEKIFKVLACRDSELAEEGAQVERLKRIMRGLKSHMEALTLVHDVAAREPTHDENVSWKRIGEIVEKGDIPKNPFKLDRVTFQSRDRDLEKFRLETPQVQLVIENVEKLEIEKRTAFLQKFAGKPVVILFDPKQKIDASRLESVKGWVRVMVGEVLGADPRRIEVIPTFYTAGLVDLAAERREGRTPKPVSMGRIPSPSVEGTAPRPTLHVVPGSSSSRPNKDPKPGGGGGGGPMTALAIPVTRDEVEWRSDVSVIPASSEERGRGSRFGNPERVVVAEKSPEDQTLDSRPRNLRVAGMTEERRMPRDRDDDLRIRLTAFAHSRGLSDVASFLSRLNEDQSHALVKNSDRWREILERKGFAEWAQQLAHGEKLSPSDRVFLVAAALGGSRKSIERLALSHAKSSAPTSPGAVAGGLIVGPVPLPGASSGILTITR